MDDFDEYGSENEFDDETPTVTCSNCGDSVYEDASQCPSCGEYLIDSSRTEFSWLSKAMVWILILAFVLPALITVLNMLR